MSAIEWTDVTWNPLLGCRRKSPGCEHCYAETMAPRLVAMGQENYRGLTVVGGDGRPRWSGKSRAVVEALDKPLHWRKPRRVFVCSMSDLFFEGHSNEEIAAVFGVMVARPEHTFQVLTKRPDRMREWFGWAREQHQQGAMASVVHGLAWDFGYANNATHAPHIWLGTSVEDQQRAQERLPDLLSCPAAVHFVSAEPLLGPVDLGPWMGLECIHDAAHVDPDTNAVDCRECDEAEHLSWVIGGGESGAGARRGDVAHLRSLRDQCADAGVAFFLKQLGRGYSLHTDLGRGFHHTDSERDERFVVKHAKGAVPEQWPEDLRVRQWPEVARA